MADLIVAKHRNGELGRTQLRFKGEYTKFVTPDPSELKQLARDAGKGGKNKQSEDEPEEDEEYSEENSDDMPDDGMVFSDDNYGGEE